MSRPNLLDVETLLARRHFLYQGVGSGLGLAALGLLSQTESTAQAAPLKTHFAPRAKRVIYLHMVGGPSQLDLFEPKPELVRRDGEACPEELTKGKRFAFIGDEMQLSGSTFRFTKHGQAGHSISETLPHFATVADEVCFLRAVHTEEINHAPAQMFLHTGFGRGNRPSLGAWLTYGLGSIADDLPGYVVMLSGPLGGAGTSLWSSGFLPSVHQGIPFRSSGDAVLFLSDPQGVGHDDRRRVLDAVGALNRRRLDVVADPEIATRIAQYELAFRMQTSVPGLMDLRDESAETLDLYGAKPGQPSFANNCLLARRLVERGVRIVELYDADWDHHGSLDTRLRAKSKDIDRGMAGLIVDLKRRGMLDDTLIVWGAEFGRTPLRQGQDGDGTKTKPGRDHHPTAFTVWLAGGGVRGGASFGKTDDFGFDVVDEGVHVHDLNATILHLLGLDHERLTYKYQGREFRLTDVAGRVVREILA